MGWVNALHTPPLLRAWNEVLGPAMALQGLLEGFKTG
jgi:hypothetical protein